MPRVPGSPEWHAHVEAVLAEEAKQPLAWWYLSFAGREEFLGCCIVLAHGMMHAVQRAHELGINPGGQVAGRPCPPSFPGPFPVNRLLSRAELDEIDRKAKAMREPPE